VGGGASCKDSERRINHQILTLTNGSFTGQFSYTAPATPGVDTLWLSEAIGYSNGWNWGTDKRLIIRNPVGINGSSTIAGYSLKQNYPNPFNPVTTIKFELRKSSFVSLTIFNIEGKAVEVLLNKNMQQGTQSIVGRLGIQQRRLFLQNYCGRVRRSKENDSFEIVAASGLLLGL
jgi:hypothetical protein